MAGFGIRSVSALRMVPHPSVTLAVEFGDGTFSVDDSTGRQQRRSFVAGAGFGFGGAVRMQGGNVEAVQVRLSPAIAHAVLGVAPGDLPGAVDLDDLWGRDASRMRDQLGEASCWEERFALTEVWLARRGEAPSRVDPEVAWAWERIVAAGGRVRVAALAAEIGWSRKRLWSRFQAQIGLRPKRAAKLVRFDHAVHRLVAGVGPAQVAAESGYTDQSHLHRDTAAFSAATPATVAREPWLAIDDFAWPAPEAFLVRGPGQS